MSWDEEYEDGYFLDEEEGMDLIEDGPDVAMASWGVAGVGGQDVEALSQFGDDLGRAQDVQPGGG